MKHLLFTLILVILAVTLQLTIGKRHAQPLPPEDILLLPQDFNAESIGSIIIQNSDSSTTLQRTPLGWTILEKQQAFAKRQDIDTLIFALCTEKARLVPPSPNQENATGFSPAPTGASLTLCDKDGNAIQAFCFGALLEGYDGTPQQRYVQLPDKRIAQTPFLAIQLQRHPEEWLRDQVEDLGIPKKITCIRNGKIDWIIARQFQRFQLQSNLAENLTSNPEAIDRVVASLLQLKISDVLPAGTAPEQSGQNAPVTLAVTREDGIILYFSFGKMPNGRLSLRIIAEPPYAKLITREIDNATDDEKLRNRRETLEKAANDFNERYAKWLFIPVLPNQDSLLPPLEKLIQKLPALFPKKP